MKKLIILFLTLSLFTSLSAQVFTVKESVSYSTVIHTINDSDRYKVGSISFGSTTELSSETDYFDIQSVFTISPSYICTDSYITSKYDLSDNIAVAAGVNFKFADITNANYLKINNKSSDVSATSKNTNLVFYTGIITEFDWKMFNIKNTAMVGYNCIDNITMNVNGNTFSKSEGNSCLVSFRIDIKIWDYISFYAGIKSYQTTREGIFDWWPTSINNSIGITAQYPITKNFSVYGQFDHYCRHPEIPEYKNTKHIIKEDFTETFLFGFKFSY